MSSPLSTSIPASSLAAPVALLLRVMILSARLIVSVLTVVVVPETVKSPVTVRLLPIVTSLGKPIVTVSPEIDVSISFAVPAIVKVSVARFTPSPEPDSAATVHVVDMLAVLPDVILPDVSTAITGTSVELHSLLEVTLATYIDTAQNHTVPHTHKPATQFTP